MMDDLSAAAEAAELTAGFAGEAETAAVVLTCCCCVKLLLLLPRRAFFTVDVDAGLANGRSRFGGRIWLSEARSGNDGAVEGRSLPA